MSYESSYQSRTAGGPDLVKSVQSWKTTKPKTSVEDNIANALVSAKNMESRTATDRFSITPENKLNNPNAYSFKDVVDIINPLHHVPVIGTVYRKLTGDTLHPASRIIGGSIYGGPIGAVTSTLSSISEMQSGQDINDRALGMITGSRGRNSYQQKMAAHAYQPDRDDRTAGHKQHQHVFTGADAVSFTEKETYMLAPVTTMALSPMPKSIL